MDGSSAPIPKNRTEGREPPPKGRAGAAASSPYTKYLEAFELTVHPRHNDLQTRFTAYLRRQDPHVTFPDTYRDDLRYCIGDYEVMVEIKPADQATLRYAIRMAIGQLLDYKQHQQWVGRQLILVDTEVAIADDMMLAFENGFGLAWPIGAKRFKIAWPKTPTKPRPLAKPKSRRRRVQ